MSGWIMSIIGMVLTVTLTEVMLPEGQTAKYIKGVISLMIVYVVIAPIPALLQSKIDINSFFDFSTGSYESSGSFIEIIKEDKQSAYRSGLAELYKRSGLESASAVVVLDDDSNVKQVILTSEEGDLDEAYRLTIEWLGVKEEQIVINEICT